MDAELICELREEALSHITRLDDDYHQGTSNGRKLFIFETVIPEIVRLGADAIQSLFGIVLMFAIALVILVRLDIRLTLVVLPLAGLAPLIRTAFKATLRSLAQRTEEYKQRSFSGYEEQVNAAQQVQLLMGESAQRSIALSGWRRLFHFARVYSNIEQRQHFIAQAVSSLAILGVFAYGISRVHAGLLSIGTVVAFYGCVFKLFQPLLRLVVLRSNLSRSCIQVAELRRLLATKAILNSPQSCVAQSFWTSAGVLELANIVFCRKNHPLVLRIDRLTFAPRSHTALVGPSGSGKTTLAKLITLLILPSEGTITYNNVKLGTEHVRSARRHIAYLPQHPVLFQGSIRSNLSFGLVNPQQSELDLALHVAGIDWSPSSLTKRLGPNGGHLSGGERQRVAIARMLVRRPLVLLMDEATNAFDLDSEALFFKRVRTFYPDLTLIAITHRVDCSHWADSVVRLENGNITCARIAGDQSQHSPSPAS